MKSEIDLLDAALSHVCAKSLGSTSEHSVCVHPIYWECLQRNLCWMKGKQHNWPTNRKIWLFARPSWKTLHGDSSQIRMSRILTRNSGSARVEWEMNEQWRMTNETNTSRSSIRHTGHLLLAPCRAYIELNQNLCNFKVNEALSRKTTVMASITSSLERFIHVEWMEMHRVDAYRH